MKVIGAITRVERPVNGHNFGKLSIEHLSISYPKRSVTQCYPPATATPTPVITATVGASTGGYVPPPKVYPPTVAPSPTPVFNFKPLPEGFNPGGWCVKVAASAVHLPDGHRLEGQDGFVYLSPEALGLRLIVERHNWYYDFTFSQCGQYQ